MEESIVRQAGLKFHGIYAGKWRHYRRAWYLNLLDIKTWLLNFRDVFTIFRGMVESWRLLKKFAPDVVFAKGGYVSLPVGLAARVLRIPYLIHESDTVPGRTNRLLAGGAKKIAVGFPENNYPRWPADKLVFTGSPVRRSILGRHRLEGALHFHLDPKLPIILIMGGSRGARFINEVVMAALPQLLGLTQVIHVTGADELESVQSEAKRLVLTHPERYRSFAFLLEDLDLALAAADVVVSRAGANAIAEFAATKKPTILVPASQLRDQPQNARVLSRQGAAQVIFEEKFTPAQLVAAVTKLLASESDQQAMGEAIGRLARPDAAKRLARLILEVGDNV